MKGLRDRMNKTLTINVESKVVQPRNLSRANSPNIGKKTARQMTESDFRSEYKLKSKVMDSCHDGMQVLSGTRARDGMELVIKIRDRSNSFADDAEEREWRATTEVQLNMPRTDTICQLMDFVVTKKNYYVVMEKVEGKDLFEQMARGRMKQSDMREVVYQILEALKTFHEQGRIHKDLKLENVMVNMKSTKEPSSPGGRVSRMASKDSAASQASHISFGSIGGKSTCSVGSLSPAGAKDGSTSPKVEPTSPGVKLIDFDTCSNYEPESPKVKDVLGSDGYLAPEAYLGIYSPASDIYCVGVIMYKLMTRAFPFPLSIFDDKPGENWVGSPAMIRIHERLKVERADFTRFPFDQCPEAAELCASMLRFDMSQRPSAEAALSHSWFRLSEEELSPRFNVGARATPAPAFQLPTSSLGLPKRVTSS